MLREHNVFNITFSVFQAARASKLQDAGNVFSLPFIITLYTSLALSAIK
jgi:hypothetical protein